MFKSRVFPADGLPTGRSLLRIEHRGRTIAASDSLDDLLRAFQRLHRGTFFVCDVFVDRRGQAHDPGRRWGRLVGYPNGIFSAEPAPRAGL